MRSAFSHLDGQAEVPRRALVAALVFASAAVACYDLLLLALRL